MKIRLICGRLLFGLLIGGAAVQASAAREQAARLPRIGTIKDYPATGLMTGCGNVYVTHAAYAEKTSPAYLFLSGPEGDNAWMNLNGRDTRLKHIKSWRSQETDPMERTFYSAYRVGSTRIQIESKPDRNSVDGLSAVKITVENGDAREVVQAVGSSDC